MVSDPYLRLLSRHAGMDKVDMTIPLTPSVSHSKRFPSHDEFTLTPYVVSHTLPKRRTDGRYETKTSTRGARYDVDGFSLGTGVQEKTPSRSRPDTPYTRDLPQSRSGVPRGTWGPSDRSVT